MGQILGIILFILEIYVTSYGILSIGGVIALLLGSVMLIDAESPLEFVAISWKIIIPVVIFTAAFFIFAIGMGIRAHRRKPVTGVQGIIGEVGQAITDINPEGQVRVHGETWIATSAEGKIKAGTRIQVERIKNLLLTVRKAV